MNEPIKVAIVGGGCAGITAAFELTRPEHDGKYAVTMYQLGWRLGGKGASGRGPAKRIEEHGLHVWMGFYENAFRLLRECYSELDRDPDCCPIASWRDAFIPDSWVGVADQSRTGQWLQRMAPFPEFDGSPGDPFPTDKPFTVQMYLTHTVALLKTLLTEVQTYQSEDESSEWTRDQSLDDGSSLTRDETLAQIAELFRYGILSTGAGLTAAVGLLSIVIEAAPTYPQNVILDLLKRIAQSARTYLEALAKHDETLRLAWEIIDLVIAILVGIIRDGLLFHPKGFDAINHYECLEWLELHGASPSSTRSAFVSGLYDLAFAKDADGPRPGLAAGQAIRGSMRMLFTYRESMFWKMRAGMGDIVFAPFYEVLKSRGVRFEFFHRLKNVEVHWPATADPQARPFVRELEFNVQARTHDDAPYEPLIDVKGLPCWPSEPDVRQLIGGEALLAAGCDFESDWDSTSADTRRLNVEKDFDFVVLAVGIGEIPRTCSEIVARDDRWRSMVEHVQTCETQAFQVWLTESMLDLGWQGAAGTLSAYVHPFNTWADMSHLAPFEDWDASPGAVAYFCNVLMPDESLDSDNAEYPAVRSQQVRDNAVNFLESGLGRIWPKAIREGSFRWDILVDAGKPDREGADRFAGQYWRANVNASDRYVLCPPGSLEHRISPLDETYDNLTIAGDWTDCGFNEGCVEAAVMSGRLAAHAISLSPALDDIIGYDHP